MRTSTKSIFTTTLLCCLALGLGTTEAAPHAGPPGHGVKGIPRAHPPGVHHNGQPGAIAKNEAKGLPQTGEGSQVERTAKAGGPPLPPAQQGAQAVGASADQPHAAVRPSGPLDPGVNRRQENQERRIVQGAKSGELTGPEVFRLQQEEKHIRAEEQAYKADGKLTPAERKDLHQDLNKVSKDIQKEKHDGQRRLPPSPPPPPLPPSN